MQDTRVTIRRAGGEQDLLVSSDLTFSQALFMAGFFLTAPLCGGIGRCGKCLIRYLVPAPDATPVERDILPLEGLARGDRLACRHYPRPGDIIEVLSLPCPRYTSTKGLHGKGLAVDLGTTTLKWALVSEALMTSGSEINPQMGGGSEVMSRIAFAARGAAQQEYLRQVVIERLETWFKEAKEVESLVVVGNSAMMYLLLGLDLKGLASSPYRLSYHGDSMEQLSPLLPAAYIPPLIAPFLGADISAGLGSLLLDPAHPKYPFLFCDLGTNGEFVLALSPEEFLGASIPMGPALEGVGLRLGAPAGPGVITRFSLQPGGVKPWGAPAGNRMSGSGYLSLLALLFRLGLVNVSGGFEPPGTPLASRIVAETDKGRLMLRQGIVLDGKDVEEVLKVKAAFNLGVSKLLQEAGLSLVEVKRIVLAGALGEHISIDDLTTLGFLPVSAGNRTVTSGNTALGGAGRLLNNIRARRRTKEIAERIQVLDLAAAPDFQASYIERMRFGFVE